MFLKSKKLVTFKTGKLDSNAAEEGGKYPFFTCAQTTYQINTFAYDTECVLLAGNNAAGIFPLKYFKGKFNAYQRTYIIEPIDKKILNIKYFYFYLRPLLKAFEQQATGATTKFLTLKILNNLEIYVPNILSQVKIASILSGYDDLIENNRRRIAILENMAEEIFREWFVRMRFPGNEKAKFEKGIPKDWEIVKLNEIAKENSKSTRPGNHLDNRYYLPLDIMGSKQFLPLDHYHYTEAQSSLITFEKGEFIFGAMRPYQHKIVIAPFDGITRTTCFVIKPKEEYLYSYLYLTLFKESTIDYAMLISNGSDRPYTVWNRSFERMEVLRPDQKTLELFEEKVRPILDSILSYYFIQRKLKETRDMLLPRLISGKLSVENLDIQFPPSMLDDEQVA